MLPLTCHTFAALFPNLGSQLWLLYVMSRERFCMLQFPCAGLRAQWVSYELRYSLYSPGARLVKTGLKVLCGRWAPGTAI